MLSYLRGAKGASLYQLIAPEGDPSGEPVMTVMDNDEAEDALLDLVEHFHTSEDGVWLQQEIDMLEDALRAIKNLVLSQHDHPDMVRHQPPGSLHGDIIRLIDPVLRE